MIPGTVAEHDRIAHPTENGNTHEQARRSWRMHRALAALALLTAALAGCIAPTSQEFTTQHLPAVRTVDVVEDALTYPLPLDDSDTDRVAEKALEVLYWADQPRPPERLASWPQTLMEGGSYVRLDLVEPTVFELPNRPDRPTFTVTEVVILWEIGRPGPEDVLLRVPEQGWFAWSSEGPIDEMRELALGHPLVEAAKAAQAAQVSAAQAREAASEATKPAETAGGCEPQGWQEHPGQMGLVRVRLNDAERPYQPLVATPGLPASAYALDAANRTLTVPEDANLSGHAAFLVSSVDGEQELFLASCRDLQAVRGGEPASLMHLIAWPQQVRVLLVDPGCPKQWERSDGWNRTGDMLATGLEVDQQLTVSYLAGEDPGCPTGELVFTYEGPWTVQTRAG